MVGYAGTSIGLPPYSRVRGNSGGGDGSDRALLDLCGYSIRAAE